MNSNAKHVWNPDRLDVGALAQAGASLTGCDPLSRFERLMVEAVGDQADAVRVQWEARGEWRAGVQGGEGAPWLHLQAQVAIPLPCQRCLGPVTTELVLDRWFRFVADEATAEAQDEDSEEDVLSLEPRPSLRELIEDELLMALPMVPMHHNCPQSVMMQAGDLPSEPESEPVVHPFAALKHLKK